MDYQYPDCCIVQFAKAPVMGTVKTRLQPTLGQEQCLALHKALVAHMVDSLSTAGIAPFELWVAAPDGIDPVDSFDFLSPSGSHRFPLKRQVGKTLGERMANAIDDRLSAYKSVLIIGSDCPAIDADYIERACSALQSGVPAVFGPAADGGYVLVGMSQLERHLYTDIPWGSDQVMSATRQRLSELNWGWQELGYLMDIDRPEDLFELKGFPSLSRFCVV